MQFTSHYQEEYEHPSEQILSEDEDEDAVNNHQRVLMWLKDTDRTHRGGTRLGRLLDVGLNFLKSHVALKQNANCFPFSRVRAQRGTALEASYDDSRPSTTDDFLRSQSSAV